MARFTDAHIFAILDLINTRKAVSRVTMVEETGLGEGSVRSMLKVLTEWEWVTITRRGVQLTEFGRSSFLGFGLEYVQIYNRKYAVGVYQQGIIVRGGAKDVTNGMKQRDMAVRSGAEGASIFIVKEGKMIFPANWDLDEQDPKFASELRATGMAEGDALILVGADTELTAKVAAAAVGLAMR